MHVLGDYWPIILLAALVLAVLAFVLLRPRQRVQLSDKTPTRPHMTARTPVEGRGLASEAAAATTDIAGELLEAPVHHHRDAGGERRDDFTRMKGVGPKFADTLYACGFYRFEQLASLTPTEIERLDERLGAFRGRLIRDRIVEQADYLAREDIDGYEQKFGKL